MYISSELSSSISSFSNCTNMYVCISSIGINQTTTKENQINSENNVWKQLKTFIIARWLWNSMWQVCSEVIKWTVARIMMENGDGQRERWEEGGGVLVEVESGRRGGGVRVRERKVAYSITLFMIIIIIIHSYLLSRGNDCNRDNSDWRAKAI